MVDSFKSIIGSVHNLSKYEHLYVLEWRYLSAFDCMLNVAALFTQDFEFVLLSYFSLINLTKSRENLAKLVALNQVISAIVELLSECSKKLALNQNLERKPFRLEIVDTDEKEMCIVAYRQTIFRFSELIHFLSRLVDINDFYRHDLYSSFGLSKCVNVLLFNGNDFEKELVIKLVWSLCKDQRVSTSILADINLYSYLLGISKNEHVTNRALLKYSNLILYLIESNVSKQSDNARRRSVSYKSYSEINELFEDIRL